MTSHDEALLNGISEFIERQARRNLQGLCRSVAERSTLIDRARWDYPFRLGRSQRRKSARTTRIPLKNVFYNPPHPRLKWFYGKHSLNIEANFLGGIGPAASRMTSSASSVLIFFAALTKSGCAFLKIRYGNPSLLK